MVMHVDNSIRDTYEALMAVGFGDYEARAYCALLLQSPANGYQVAKQSGIPRGKIYECLERLVARGAALRVETLDETIRLFAPTDPRELIDGIENNSSMVCDRARKALERYRSDPHVVEIVWRVTSQQDLIARGCSLTQDAGKTLHVALWHEEFHALLPSLLEAMARGVKIALVLYSFHPGIRKLQKLKAAAIQHSQSKRQVVPVLGRQFVLVADGERCITGSIFPNQRVEGVFTLNRGLVTNAIDLVNHEIYLERILAEVGKPIWDIFGKTLHKLNAFDPFKGK